MKKRINVITFCTCGSIGSILQSHALTKTLEENGCETTLWLEERKRIVSKKTCSVKDYVKQMYRKFYNRRFLSAHRKRMDFISAHMNTEYLPDWEVFHKKALENKDNIYLTGSDQVWNPELCRPLFFLDFAGDSKRISYAASMGQTKIPPKNEERIREWLSSFDQISVREQECVDVLRKMTDKEISVHIDPTFLIDVNEWRSLERSYRVKGPYILLYMLYWDDSCKKKIAELKKRTGLPVYAICSDVSRVYADRRLFDVGVEEFLWLVDHAEYVVTSSFHGVALSIIFRKKFAPVTNPSSPSRIENILRILDVPCVDIHELDRADDFDYDAISANIERERQKSITYLKDAVK